MSFMLDCRNHLRNTNIGLWARRWTLLGRWWPRALMNIVGFNNPIAYYAQVVNCFRSVSHLVQRGDIATEYRGLDLCWLKILLSGLYPVKCADE